MTTEPEDADNVLNVRLTLEQYVAHYSAVLTTEKVDVAGRWPTPIRTVSHHGGRPSLYYENLFKRVRHPRHSSPSRCGGLPRHGTGRCRGRPQ
jgi:hypothetical protein